MEQSGMYDKSGKPVPQKLILISPTTQSNLAFKRLKHLDKKDIHESYTDKLLHDIVDEIKADRTKTLRYHKACFLWKIFKSYLARDKDPLLKMSQEDLQLLTAETQGFREDPIVPPNPRGCVVTLILDDLLGSPAFSLNRGNFLGAVACNSRHWFLNVLVITQRLKQCPPLIRANCTLLMHWRCMSKKIMLEEIFPCLSALVDEQTFLALFEAATRDNKYDALVVDTTATDPKNLFRKNLNQSLSFPSSNAVAR